MENDFFTFSKNEGFALLMSYVREYMIHCRKVCLGGDWL